MSSLYVPHLAEVERVAEDRLYEYPGAHELIEAMAGSGIACFTDEADDYWFGSDAPEMHEHDRWLYLLTRQERLRGGYLAARFRVLAGCGDELRTVQGMGDLIDEVEDLARQQGHTLARLDVKDPVERTRLVRNFLIASRILGRRSPVNMVPFTRAPWGQELHDIVKHWDAWCAANNPDDLPRDLVLRMHGLGAYADEVKNRTSRW